MTHSPALSVPQGSADVPSGPVGVTAPGGFSAAGVEAGLKAHGGRDVALVVTTGPRPASAGVFTSNRVVAAPVTLTRAHLAASTLRAVVLNSGGANACTGADGARDAAAIAQRTAAAVGVAPDQVGVCSTGLIGERLPLGVLLPGVDAAAAALASGARAAWDAADAIRTTDTVRKTVVVSRGGWTVGGMAKGAGMLAPGLATMLCVLTTDAVLDGAQAADALRRAVRTTFNRTDSDGCMSTNDSVLLLASGASGVAPDLEEFGDGLREACAGLARQLIGDAEGASHDIAITVVGASDERAGEAVARSVARSNLFKTAVFGNDPNWGRVLSEVGTVPVDVAPFDPARLDVSINGVQVCRAGGVGEPRDLVDMSAREVHVLVDLHAGNAEVTVWTNDLTHDYVHENSAYSS